MKIIKHLKNNLYFLKYVMDFSKSYVIGQAVVALIDGISPLIHIILPKFIIDELIKGNDFKKIIIYVLIYILLQLMVSLISSFIKERYININGHLYAMHFLLTINKKIVSLDMAQLDLPDTHQKIALAKDIVHKGIGMNLINSFFNCITSIVVIISTSLIVITADSRLLFVIVIFSLLSIFLNIKNENWILNQREENIYLTRVLNYYIGIMGNKTHAKEMRMFGFSNWLMNKYYKTLKSLKVRLKKLYSRSLSIKIINIFFENIKTNGIYLFLAWKTFKHEITIGGFTQYFNATSQLSNAILNFMSFFTKLTINGKYIDSYRSFMELESNIENDNISLCFDKVKLNKIQKIRLENVSFAYPNSKLNILENVNFTFESGKIYVIVGENGAGKTTLINLIARLYEPSKGNIYLNDIPINKINYKEYRNNFSIVFQDFKYFSFTVAENVALDKYKENSKEIDEKIISALDKAKIWNKVNSLPNGINTNLDKIFYEDGVILSGGENQKIALARALFRDSEIIILDEPSSALDPIAEDELLSSFKEIASDKMVIYISHRLTCANIADQIIFIKNNTIHETGSHQELMDKNGDYARYYKTQAKHYVSHQASTSA
ncbi:ABC transporter ATP-binding protein [Tepidibacter thalassicus]|uniref:ATP-binding cassette, subfamily C n=1 Tax=Tepidibacter thalassicus DSM 15285 TaxID=1123350 RepID=A0A1M5QJ58_9FIRM|nr:ABC transporter ATP-binding protein [Tepidibacter thalassicus]SHH13829.1 ATP-binding cassette, subfamily C [Tepidibacter thalassicus DSM 15285]